VVSHLGQDDAVDWSIKPPIPWSCYEVPLTQMMPLVLPKHSDSIAVGVVTVPVRGTTAATTNTGTNMA
jgi:hypothetical protein